VTPAARLLAVLIGVVGIVLAAAALVREAVLAAGWSIRWPLPQWWTDLTAGSSWRLWLAAAVSILLTIALLLYAFRQLGGSRPAPSAVEFRDGDVSARLDVGALERGLGRRLQAELPGLTTRSLELVRTGDGWYARLEADVPARDLAGLHKRAGDIVADGLLRTGSMRLARLDLVARRVLRPAAPA
jgi:hypothetical protein